MGGWAHDTGAPWMNDARDCFLVGVDLLGEHALLAVACRGVRERAGTERGSYLGRSGRPERGDMSGGRRERGRAL